MSTDKYHFFNHLEDLKGAAKGDLILQANAPFF